MALEPGKIADLRIKQLELAQGLIARMANYCATLKNYCLTLAAAIFGVSVNAKSPAILLAALLAISMFAILDAQYLGLERRYRGLYERIRKEDWNAIPDFDLSVQGIAAVTTWKVMYSWSIWLFYGPIFLGLTAILVIMRLVYGHF